MVPTICIVSNSIYIAISIVLPDHGPNHMHQNTTEQLFNYALNYSLTLAQRYCFNNSIQALLECDPTFNHPVCVSDDVECY
jgi:hypothetical protein